MSKLILIISFLSLSACGIAEKVHCQPGDLRTVCVTLVGERNDEQDTALQQTNSDIELLKQRVSLLESQMSQNIATIGDLSVSQNFQAAKLLNLQQNVEHNKADIEAALAAQNADQAAALAIQNTVLQLQINNLIVQQANLTSVVNTIQTTVTNQQAALYTLQHNEYIIDFHDFCGAAPGYNEIGMRTSSGKLVAYFENGGSRFLSVIIPGNYRTTDGSNCYFTVNAAGQVINEHY